ncbi:hypothetical protein AGMMS49579_26140 [Spirochaetia bacterium]|nr:hypothetical protein AGMMS49579_26140 [Spirochaetia bacterium]
MPHVSELQAEVRNNLIRLTWTDSPDAQGPVFVYSSNSPFDPAYPSLGQHQPVEVPYGVASYIDETENSGIIHYFVAASSSNWDQDKALWVTEVYNLIIPLSNTISADASFVADPVLATVSTPDDARTEVEEISALQAVIDGEGVTISFEATNSLRNTVLYRSVQPIQGAEDLLRAVIVQAGLTSPFVDYPVPGISYYYAVVFEDELSRGSVKIVPRKNATTEPVEVSSLIGRVGLPWAHIEPRSMPLPLMALNYAVPGIDSFSELSRSIPLSPEAARALSNIPKRNPEIVVPQKPRAFNVDLNKDNNGPGEESDLKAIVQGSFLAQDWEKAIAELRRYLTIPRSELTEARSRFYLGQSLFFSGNYREALFEFIMIKAQFPREATEWIDASLAQLINR